MAISRKRAKTKRYIRELIHIFRFTYEDISHQTGIDIDRLKAINRKEEPTPEEVMLIGKLSVKLSMGRAEDDGE
jgi:hypothetical protein